MPCPSLALEVRCPVDELFICSAKKGILCLSQSSFKLQPWVSSDSSTEGPMLQGNPSVLGKQRDQLLPHRDIHDTIIIQGHLRMTLSLTFLAGLRRCVFTFFPASLSRLFDLCSGEQTGPVGKGVTIGKVLL